MARVEDGLMTGRRAPTNETCEGLLGTVLTLAPDYALVFMAVSIMSRVDRIIFSCRWQRSRLQVSDRRIALRSAPLWGLGDGIAFELSGTFATIIGFLKGFLSIGQVL